jgi:hypothetical protein
VQKVNWKLVAYTVGGCWLVFAFLFLPGKQIGLFLNPFPIVLKGLIGGAIYGYVGAAGGRDIETIFVYWTMLGLVLAWCLHKFQRNPVNVTAIIAVAGVVHVGLTVLAFFPAMLIAGR